MLHYNCFSEALSSALMACFAWESTGNGEEVTMPQLMGLEQKEPGEGEYYVVSCEGAIGLAEKYEYRVKWLYLPLPEDRQKELISEFKEEIQARQNMIITSSTALEGKALYEEENAAQSETFPAAEEPESVPDTQAVPEAVPGEAEPAHEIPASKPVDASMPEPVAEPEPEAAPEPEPEAAPEPEPEKVPEPEPGHVPAAEEEPKPIPDPVPEAKPAAALLECPNCHKPVRPTDKFCMSCGFRLPEPGSATQPASVEPPKPAEPVCPNCGKPVRPTDRFCMLCGTKLQ